MAPHPAGRTRELNPVGAASGLWARLAFPLITAALVLLLGVALFGLAS
jgi:hypothetical protein